MVQGQIKQKSSGSILAKQAGKQNKRISRGMRVAPKSQGAQKEKAMQKKLSARNIQNTEIQMSVKAASTGKLTIMKGIADKAMRDKKEAEIKKDSKKK